MCEWGGGGGRGQMGSRKGAVGRGGGGRGECVGGEQMGSRCMGWG